MTKNQKLQIIKDEYQKIYNEMTRLQSENTKLREQLYENNGKATATNS